MRPVDPWWEPALEVGPRRPVDTELLVVALRRSAGRPPQPAAFGQRGRHDIVMVALPGPSLPQHVNGGSPWTIRSTSVLLGRCNAAFNDGRAPRCRVDPGWRRRLGQSHGCTDCEPAARLRPAGGRTDGRQLARPDPIIDEGAGRALRGALAIPKHYPSTTFVIGFYSWQTSARSRRPLKCSDSMSRPSGTTSGGAI